MFFLQQSAQFWERRREAYAEGSLQTQVFRRASEFARSSGRNCRAVRVLYVSAKAGEKTEERTHGSRSWICAGIEGNVEPIIRSGI